MSGCTFEDESLKNGTAPSGGKLTGAELLTRILDELEKNEHAILEKPWQKFPDYITAKEPLSGKRFVIFMNVPGDRIGLADGSDVQIMNVKADPDFISLIAGNDGYAPAYHMNKEHWLSVRLDGSVPYDEVMSLIRHSFEMVSETPTRRIYEAVKGIPRGKVATYKRVAELAGNPRMSRAVGNALHSNPDPEHIPCYRVVNSRGELSGRFAFGGEEAQKKLLEADGIVVRDNRVDLQKYGV